MDHSKTKIEDEGEGQQMIQSNVSSYRGQVAQVSEAELQDLDCAIRASLGEPGLKFDRQKAELALESNRDNNCWEFCNTLLHYIQVISEYGRVSTQNQAAKVLTAAIHLKQALSNLTTNETEVLAKGILQLLGTDECCPSVQQGMSIVLEELIELSIKSEGLNASILGTIFELWQKQVVDSQPDLERLQHCYKHFATLSKWITISLEPLCRIIGYGLIHHHLVPVTLELLANSCLNNDLDAVVELSNRFLDQVVACLPQTLCKSGSSSSTRFVDYFPDLERIIETDPNFFGPAFDTIVREIMTAWQEERIHRSVQESSLNFLCKLLSAYPSRPSEHTLPMVFNCLSSMLMNKPLHDQWDTPSDLFTEGDEEEGFESVLLLLRLAEDLHDSMPQKFCSALLNWIATGDSNNLIDQEHLKVHTISCVLLCSAIANNIDKESNPGAKVLQEIEGYVDKLLGQMAEVSLVKIDDHDRVMGWAVLKLTEDSAGLLKNPSRAMLKCFRVLTSGTTTLGKLPRLRSLAYKALTELLGQVFTLDHSELSCKDLLELAFSDVKFGSDYVKQAALLFVPCIMKLSSEDFSEQNNNSVQDQISQIIEFYCDGKNKIASPIRLNALITIFQGMDRMSLSELEMTIIGLLNPTLQALENEGDEHLEAFLKFFSELLELQPFDDPQYPESLREPMANLASVLFKILMKVFPGGGGQGTEGKGLASQRATNHDEQTILYTLKIFSRILKIYPEKPNETQDVRSEIGKVIINLIQPHHQHDVRLGASRLLISFVKTSEFSPQFLDGIARALCELSDAWRPRIRRLLAVALQEGYDRPTAQVNDLDGFLNGMSQLVHVSHHKAQLLVDEVKQNDEFLISSVMDGLHYESETLLIYFDILKAKYFSRTTVQLDEAHSAKLQVLNSSEEWLEQLSKISSESVKLGTTAELVRQWGLARLAVQQVWILEVLKFRLCRQSVLEPVFEFLQLLQHVVALAHPIRDMSPLLEMTLSYVRHFLLPLLPAAQSLAADSSLRQLLGQALASLQGVIAGPRHSQFKPQTGRKAIVDEDLEESRSIPKIDPAKTTAAKLRHRAASAYGVCVQLMICVSPQWISDSEIDLWLQTLPLDSKSSEEVSQTRILLDLLKDPSARERLTKSPALQWRVLAILSESYLTEEEFQIEVGNLAISLHPTEGVETDNWTKTQHTGWLKLRELVVKFQEHGRK